MEKQNLTIWQKLSKTFGPNSLLGMLTMVVTLLVIKVILIMSVQ
jgi:hypothetical protein